MARGTKDTRTQYREVSGAGNTDARARLDARLLAIQRGEDFPALSRAIVDALTAIPDDEESLQRLANLVMREYALTLRVIRAANSVLYRRSDRPVQSATHAMMLLGADSVRRIAASLVLFEHFHRRSSGLRELMLLSLLTANHAREIAIRAGGIDPEEAHLSGMFRNLGEVLIAAHFATDHARIRDLVEGWGRSESQAAAVTLGCSYDTVGEEIGRFWGLPPSVLAVMRSDASQARSRAVDVVALGHELTNVVYRRGDALDALHLSRLVAESASRLGLPAEAVPEVLECALAETRDVFAASGVRLDDLRLRRQSEAACSALGMAAPATVPADTVAAPPDARAIRGDLRQSVAAAADPAGGDDVHRLLMVTLEGVYRGCPLDRAVMIVLSADRRELHGRLGFGPGIDTLLEWFRFSLTPRDGPIALAALRKRPVCVPMEREYTAQEARWADSLGVSSFVVVPLQVHGRVIGCVYGDRGLDRQLPAPDDLVFLRELCAMAERGLEARSGRATSHAAAG